MGKSRKHKRSKSKEHEAEGSSEEGTPVCPHIAKAVNFAAMRKTLSKAACTLGECTNCAVEAAKSGSKKVGEEKTEREGEDLGFELETTIWVCLHCGHQGCDRNSKDKHALKHFETPHSGTHSIVVNLTSWATWCYTCDDEISVGNSKRIQECVDFLRKQSGLSSNSANQKGSQVTSHSNTSHGDSNPPSQSVTDKSQESSKSSAVVCQKVKGLNNLGNTCFFNSVMQNLCQTQGLEALLTETCQKGHTMSVGGWTESLSHSDSSSDEEEDECCTQVELAPIEIVPGDPGPLTLSLLKFVQEMNSSNVKGTITPNNLFGNICKKATRFKGFQQQDSQELLRYLMDVVRTEEIKRAQTGILKVFKLPEQTNPKEVNEGTKQKIKEYGRQAKFTVLDSLFGGQLISTITCEECRHVSQIFEPFLDLSLPVTEDKLQRANQMLGGRNKGGMQTNMTETVEETKPLKGVDGFAANCKGPSKYQERKNRRQAKKEAKRKGRQAGHSSNIPKKQSVDEEEEGDKESVVEQEEKAEEEENRETQDTGIRDDVETGSSKQTVEENEKNLQKDQSAAEILDNAEKEGHEVCAMTGDNISNLPVKTTANSHSRSNCSNLAEDHSSEEEPFNDLNFMSSTVKETHILPAEYQQAGDSPSVRTDKDKCGIKEKKNREIEKLANSLSDLELNESTNIDRIKQESSSLTESASSVMTDSGKGEGDFISGTEQHHPEKLETVFQKEDCVKCERTEEMAAEERPSEVGNSSAGSEGNKDHSIAEDKNVAVCEAVPDTSERTTCQSPSFDRLAEIQQEVRHKAKSTLAPRCQPASKQCTVMSCLQQFTSAELLTGPNRVKCKQCGRLQQENQSSEKDKKGTKAVYSNASKQFLIMVPPAVLTLHLKRFEQVGFATRKVNGHVDFPTVLDVAPYCSALCQQVRAGQRQVLYSLYGVVEHSGRLHGGHYTAYVKVRPGLSPVNNFLLTEPPHLSSFMQRLVDQVSNGEKAKEDDSVEIPPLETLVPQGSWFHISDSRVNAVPEATVLKAQAYLLFYERIY